LENETIRIKRKGEKMKNTQLVLGMLLIILTTVGGNLLAQGHCLDFNGANQSVIVPNFRDNANIVGQITIEAWVYADSRPQWASIAKNWGPGFFDYGLCHFGLLNDGRLHCDIRQTDNTAKGVADNVIIPVGSWQHVAFVADGSNLYLYRNGDLVSGPVAYNGTLNQGWNPLAIGAKPNVDGTATYHHWDGKIDEVRFWDVGRTQTEIQDNMNNSLTGNESSLVAYYRFDEETGSTANDSAGENDGDLSNNPTWIVSDAPLPVTLSSFTASFSEGSSLLSWTTQSESNNLGWNVYRSETENVEDLIQINQDMIEGAGTTTEQTDYTFADQYETIPNSSYWYWVESVDNGGTTNLHGPARIDIPEGEDELPPELIADYGLAQNFPNPFNPSTKIAFKLTEANAANASLIIYNSKGQVVKVFDELNTNENEVGSITWNGYDKTGSAVSSGIYLYKMKAGGRYTSTKKMILLK
jgi:hypothetical protein